MNLTELRALIADLETMLSGLAEAEARSRQDRSPAAVTDALVARKKEISRRLRACRQRFAELMSRPPGEGQ